MPTYYLIVNPQSGARKGTNILEKITPVFEQAGITLVTTISTHKNHPYELANSFPIDSFDALCVAGGDGTFHEVINGLLNRKEGQRIPIGFIPAGTGNSLMHDLNCLDPVQAARKIVEQKIGKLDICKVKTKDGVLYCFNILGWGMPASINALAERMRWMGSIRYDAASVIELISNRSQKVQLDIGDVSIHEPVSFFLACNTKFTGKGMKMAPEAQFDDGLLDVFVVRKASRLRLLSLFLKVFKGRHVGDPVIEHYKTTHFSIQNHHSQPLNIDGQNIGCTPVHATILPSALDIFI